MRRVLYIFLTLAVAFGLSASSTAMPKICACCLAQDIQAAAVCGHHRTAKVSGPKSSCCDMKAGGAEAQATLNTAPERSASISAEALSPRASGYPAVLPERDIFSKDFSPGLHAPPIYKLTSSYLC
ncbi:MAG: hypothetical protein ABSG42_05270 [Nitrospirota bacterium]